MDVEDSRQPSSANEYLAPMERYKGAVVRLFPALPRRVVDNWFIRSTDAVVLGYFLEHYPCKVVALDIGAFVGASAFCFASHPKVSKVISVDPNPVISDELTANSDRWVGEVDLEPLKDFKVLDVARAVLAEFNEGREKIEFREGVVGSTQVRAKGGSIVGLRKVEVPAVEPSEGAGLVALVDGLHTREGVREDLAAIFEKNPQAVALLDDCRYGWGPFVQAGVVDFMERAREKYHFRLFGDLGPGLAKSNLGIVYPEPVAEEMDEVLSEIRKVFSGRLDPVRLLKREEDLSSTVNRINRELEQARKNEAHLESQVSSFKERNAQLESQVSRVEKRNFDLESQVSQVKERNSNLQEQVSRLEERNARLVAHYSSRRYKLADAIAGRTLQIPGLKSLLRRSNARSDG